MLVATSFIRRQKKEERINFSIKTFDGGGRVASRNLSRYSAIKGTHQQKGNTCMATEKTNIAINVGNRIKAERVRRKISQEALAEKIGIDRKTINRIENGHFSPSLENFMLICDFLYLEPSVVLYKASSI